MVATRLIEGSVEDVVGPYIIETLIAVISIQGRMRSEAYNATFSVHKNETNGGCGRWKYREAGEDEGEDEAAEESRGERRHGGDLHDSVGAALLVDDEMPFSLVAVASVVCCLVGMRKKIPKMSMIGNVNSGSLFSLVMLLSLTFS